MTDRDIIALASLAANLLTTGQKYGVNHAENNLNAARAAYALADAMLIARDEVRS